MPSCSAFLARTRQASDFRITPSERILRWLARSVEPVDAGPLASARYLEPLAMLYIHLAFKQGWGSNSAFKVMKR